MKKDTINSHRKPSLQRSRSLTVTAVAALSACALTATAQTNAVSPDVDPRSMDSVLKRMAALEEKAKRVDELESELSALKEKTGESVPVVAPVEQWPKIEFHALGDMNYIVTTQKGEHHNQFELGDLDIVTTARLNDKASVISDLVVASNHGGYAIEIERLVLGYKFADWLNIEAGRFHTAMGWYNNFYHNGTYFQTTVERPIMYEFEDNMGPLPVHSTGISFNGDIPSGKMNLSYSAEVSMGRKYTANEADALTVEEDNEFKAVNLQLRAKPEWTPNWQFGIGIYHDITTPELDPEGNPGVNTQVDIIIASGYAIYKTPRWEWFTEGALMGDEPKGDHRHWNYMGYTQVARKFGKFKPYARAQFIAGNKSDPLYRLLGQNMWTWSPQIGIRYDFTTMMALKLQWEHTIEASTCFDEITMQWTFRF